MLKLKLSIPSCAVPLVLSCALGCSQPAAPAASPSTEPPAAAPAPAPSAAAPANAEPAGLSVGQPAPDFSVRDQNGKPVELAALRGKHVVLYFYPKDETPGCTKEAQSFRDSYDALSKKGAVIIGVSADSDESHRAFAKNHQLPFTLVSDPEGALAAKYEVPMRMSFTSRQSFVIGPDGALKKIYRDVDVNKHVDEITADVQ